MAESALRRVTHRCPSLSPQPSAGERVSSFSPLKGIVGLSLKCLQKKLFKKSLVSTGVFPRDVHRALSAARCHPLSQGEPGRPSSRGPSPCFGPGFALLPPGDPRILTSLPKENPVKDSPHRHARVFPLLSSGSGQCGGCNITSVLQKCLNIFLRPLWNFFLLQET